MRNLVSIKGTREGLTITLGEGELAALLKDLDQRLRLQGAFFRGGRVALEVGDRALAEEEIARIGELLSAHGMVLRTVVTTNEATRRATQMLGLRLLTGSPQTAEQAPRPEAPQRRSNPLDGSRGVLIRHVVRSGQVVRHTGHIVVLGDVNAGGEVVAGGDVIVWGRLYGIAHAGSMGNESAVICALEMAPLQLRIAGLIARPEEDDRRKEIYPEVAYVRDGAIVVEPWNAIPRGVI